MGLSCRLDKEADLPPPTAPPNLLDNWRRASTPPGAGPCPPGLDWQPYAGTPRGADTLDHWFRLDTPLPPGGAIEFTALATQTEIWLDGHLAATHATMFRPLLVPVPTTGVARIEACARALNPPAAQPRPRWRNRLVPGERLRTLRTSLQGRIPGSGEPVVGPCAPVWHHPTPTPLRRSVRAWLEGNEGIVEARLGGADIERHTAVLQSGDLGAPFVAAPDGLVATLRIPAPRLWWPHTHGDPSLYALDAILDDEERLGLGGVGFRTIERLPGPGLRLAVNGVPVFCRGALWSDIESRQAGPALHHARAAGLNMVRLPGTGDYTRLAGVAARLGIMIWQDFMFSRLDYPTTPEFLDEVRAEARHVLGHLLQSPALAVLCGGDEIHQAAAMAGRPVSDWTHPVFDEVLPREAAALCPDVPYIPNAPYGATPPFAKSAPVTHDFGVGAYQRPLHDAQGVRFAAACLAFSNPPDPHATRALAPTPGDAAWAATVPRDPAASWTFEDARDHYATTLFRTDMPSLRRTDPERWLAMGRAAVALAMQSALATWRTDPGCGGALILGLHDTLPGPGWGLIDHQGRPKSALHAVAAVSQPVQVLLRDEGMDGIAAYLFNDGPTPLAAALTLRGLTPSGDAELLGAHPVTLPPHASARLAATEIMGRFIDLAGTWRFAPPPYTVLGATLAAAGTLLATHTLFLDPALPRERLGLSATPAPAGLRIDTTHFAQFVAIDAGPHIPQHDHFHLWPGESRIIPLHGDGLPAGTVTALNGLDPAHFRARS